jgi:hypothetical protein
MDQVVEIVEEVKEEIVELDEALLSMVGGGSGAIGLA